MKFIKQFDTVILKDGRRAEVTEIFGDQEIFCVDTGSSPKDWDYEEVRREDIVKVIHND